jgi:hypothetical protein
LNPSFSFKYFQENPINSKKFKFQFQSNIPPRNCQTDIPASNCQIPLFASFFREKQRVKVSVLQKMEIRVI